MNDINLLLKDAEYRMGMAVEVLQRELNSTRTGRANPALVEHISVDYYGASTPLNQLATISAPDAQLLVIQPWDKSVITSIEKAILQSSLNIMPNNDGTTIRLALPHLTEERRKELVRLLRKRVEEGRVAARNVRRDVLDKIRNQEKLKEISQDESRRVQEQLQKLTNLFVEQIDNTGQAKETEVMSL